MIHTPDCSPSDPYADHHAMEPTVNYNIPPDKTALFSSIDLLYHALEEKDIQIRRQEELLRTLSVELLLAGRWKPTGLVQEVLGFSHPYYTVGCYNIWPAVQENRIEAYEPVFLKRKISACFEAAFASEGLCAFCETENCLAAMLLNTPRPVGSEDLGFFEKIKSCAENALHAIQAETGFQLTLSLGHSCKDVNLLKYALEESLSLQYLQNNIPDAAFIMFGGKLELYQMAPAPQENVDLLLKQAATAQDFDRMDQLLNQYTMEQLQQGTMGQAAEGIIRKLELIQDTLGYRQRGKQHLLSAREGLHRAQRADELLVIIYEYFCALKSLVEAEQALPQAACPLSRAQEIREYIDNCYLDASLNVAQVAEALNLDASAISKAFRQAYGIGALSYIQKRRIQYAMALLAETDLSISEIVSRSGYYNRRTFDRVFQQFSGMTAVSYRKHWKQNICPTE